MKMARGFFKEVLAASWLSLAVFLFVSPPVTLALNAAAANDYLKRFNIPENHIQLEWAKSGSGGSSFKYKGKTYTWLPGSYSKANLSCFDKAHVEAICT